LDVLIEEMDAEAKAVEADPTRKPVMTEEVVVAQCVVFFLAGFDTTGTLLTMASYYMALYPDCQERLVREIRAEMAKHEVSLSGEHNVNNNFFFAP
jgi:cytochrome P450